VTIGVLSGLDLLARHARDSTAAGSGAILQAAVAAGSAAVALGHSRGFRDTYGEALAVPPPATITAAYSLDMLATGNRAGGGRRAAVSCDRAGVRCSRTRSAKR